MKRLSLDFEKGCLCYALNKNKGIKQLSNLNRDDFKAFIPDRFIDKASYTWDFEAETISINQKSSAMTDKSFIPEVVTPYPKLTKRFQEFIRLLPPDAMELIEISQ